MCSCRLCLAHLPHGVLHSVYSIDMSMELFMFAAQNRCRRYDRHTACLTQPRIAGFKAGLDAIAPVLQRPCFPASLHHCFPVSPQHKALWADCCGYQKEQTRWLHPCLAQRLLEALVALQQLPSCWAAEAALQVLPEQAAEGQGLCQGAAMGP